MRVPQTPCLERNRRPWCGDGSTMDMHAKERWRHRRRRWFESATGLSERQPGNETQKQHSGAHIILLTFEHRKLPSRAQLELLLDTELTGGCCWESPAYDF